ncbi:hypothetical protein DMC30DRAFT_197178 [Rhodotorula diobovata]|uniref:GDP-fucose protein O-fucosyltransferase-domain-containing protein n=1 Tax=Rhodotorula diobovata TaxID=5288 RepID=A0A5C5FXB4_9BASI|nr:hypothetical protein DMC30DRAFT_197178 [Rhodotorula diobovata]
MPTPRMPRSASSSSSPFDFAARLNITISSPPSSGHSSGLSSPSSQHFPGGVAGGASEPLLPRSFHPSSPASGAHHRRTSSLSGIALTAPSSPSSSAFPPLVAEKAPPRPTRRGSPKRWTALLALALVFGLALSSTWQGVIGNGDGYATSVSEGWRAGLKGVKNWRTGLGKAGGGGPEGANEGGERDAMPPDTPLQELDGSAQASELTAEAAIDDGKAPNVLDPSVEDDEVPDSTAASDEGASASEKPTSTSTTVAPTLNVNPFPHPAPRDPKVASQMRYLAFENHSGFHNQRKSLVNALVLAQLLNRTLLIQPARLGSPVPWEFDPKFRVAFSERCKAGLEPDKPIATLSNAHAVSTGEECEDPSKWTYAGWDWLLSPSLLAGRPLVDRWNSSSAWFTAPLDEGGLGLRDDEIHRFEDVDRRSYQILDDRETQMNEASFMSRLELDDLRDEAGLGGKRLLRFGSLFSGARLKFTDEGNRKLFDDTTRNVVLQNDGLDAISDKIRGQLGSYVAAHARVGDGVFKSKAVQNMENVFRQVAHDVLGLRKADVDVLLAEVSTSAPTSKASVKAAKNKVKGKARGHRGKKVARAFGSAGPSLSLAERAGVSAPWDDADDTDEADLLFDPDERRATPLPFARARARHHRRALTGGPSQPLAPSLHCRGPLHDAKKAPHLTPLNTPLYIATDSRSPTTDPALAPFIRWFPCLFFLSDFAESSDVNDEPVSELVELVEAKGADEGGGKWTNEWDGQAMAKYLYPFLEAEIAARAVDVVGTPQSTFSGYVRGILHQAYLEDGIAAGWSGRP